MTLTRKGWNSLKPITAPEQMSTPIHWNPMSDDWKRWIDSHQVYNGESRFSKEMLDAIQHCMTRFSASAEMRSA